MKAKLGMSPIAWWNDDLPQLSDDVSLEECLRQSRSAGFTGMEKGRRFPESAAEMLPILKKADVTLCGGWFSGTILNGDIDDNAGGITLFKYWQGALWINGTNAGFTGNCFMTKGK